MCILGSVAELRCHIVDFNKIVYFQSGSYILHDRIYLFSTIAPVDCGTVTIYSVCLLKRIFAGFGFNKRLHLVSINFVIATKIQVNR